ncbi:hypothetical protein QJS66_01320 [Kocuria rhizophila]|nr:hypothetical protein QJS66_01320 [Kocuria rhizophila]
MRAWSGLERSVRSMRERIFYRPMLAALANARRTPPSPRTRHVTAWLRWATQDTPPGRDAAHRGAVPWRQPAGRDPADPAAGPATTGSPRAWTRTPVC